MSASESQAVQFKQLVESLGIAESMLRMVVGMIALRFQREQAVVVREFLRLTRVLKGAPGVESDPLTALRVYADRLLKDVEHAQRSADALATQADNPDTEFVRDRQIARAEALEECHTDIRAILDRYPTPLPPAG